MGSSTCLTRMSDGQVHPDHLSLRSALPADRQHVVPSPAAVDGPSEYLATLSTFALANASLGSALALARTASDDDGRRGVQSAA